MDYKPLAFRAKYVFTGRGQAFDGGAVVVLGQHLMAVERAGDSGSRDVVDLGDVAIVPGLVNAHAHLEFSGLSAPLGRPGMPFPAWIRTLVEWRRTATPLGGGDLAAAARLGLQECTRCGVTALGEIARPGWPQGVFASAPLESTVFLELIGLSAQRAQTQVEPAKAHLAARPDGMGTAHGLGPHAPYTVRPELLATIVELSAKHGGPVAMHLAESPEELELLHAGTGPFASLLRDLNAWDDAAIPPGSRPLDYLQTLSRAARGLAIHGNYLGDEELAFLAQHADRMSTVYCPRTHAYFGHARHPLAKLLALGANVAVGTDSRASNPDLNLWEELRFVAERFPELAPRTVLELGTWRGARALGIEGRAGSLEPHKLANLAVVELPSGGRSSTADAHERLFAPGSRVVKVMHRGTWADCPSG